MRKSKRILKNKSKLKTIKKTLKNIKKYGGGSTIYKMETNKIIQTNKTYNGKPFFKKIFAITSTPTQSMEVLNHITLAETTIAKKIMTNPYKHPNIVDIFVVNEKYILMEKLKPLDAEDYSINMNKVIDCMNRVKDFLQSLGIMYIDWKFDNIGKSKDGIYKLFDFDASGLIDLNTNKWIIEPMNFFSYRNSKERNCKIPQEIDNWSFEYNLMNNKNITCNK
jgi:hypothetical protein